MNCSSPASIADGSYSCTGMVLGESCTYVCDAGYDLIGSAMTHCDISGTGVAWNETAPVCNSMYHIPLILGSCFLKSYFHCIRKLFHSMYDLNIGSAVTHCAISGIVVAWNETVPVCNSFPAGTVHMLKQS